MNVQDEIKRREQEASRLQSISEGFLNSALMNPAIMGMAQMAQIGNVPWPTELPNLLPRTPSSGTHSVSTGECLNYSY